MMKQKKNNLITNMILSILLIGLVAIIWLSILSIVDNPKYQPNYKDSISSVKINDTVMFICNADNPFEINDTLMYKVLNIQGKYVQLLDLKQMDTTSTRLSTIESIYVLR